MGIREAIRRLAEGHGIYTSGHLPPGMGRGKLLGKAAELSDRAIALASQGVPPQTAISELRQLAGWRKYELLELVALHLGHEADRTGDPALSQAAEYVRQASAAGRPRRRRGVPSR